MTPLPIADALTLARAKIAKGWVQFSSAKDAKGIPTPTYSDKAVCWCTTGAISAVVHETAPRSDYVETHRRYVNALRAQLPYPSDPAMPILNVERYNDHVGRTQADILELFDRAIAAETAAALG